MTTRKYFGCLIRQRINEEVVPFFVFHARVKDVYEWVGIRRIEDLPDGTQRVLKETRARSITRFLKSESINTIPNSLLIAFEPGIATFISVESQLEACMPDSQLLNGCESQSEWGYLEFSFEKGVDEHLRPGLIVDGQHRLHGMNDFGDENLPVFIVSLVNASKQEQAFQFIVVNNKLVKVPPDNVKAIVAEFDEQELQSRLLSAGIKFGDASPVLLDIDDSPSSPFQNLLDWPRNRTGTKIISLTAIEQSLRYLRTVFDFLDDDEDSQVQIFMAMWRAIKAKYANLWGHDNNLMKKVSINALNEFIADRLKIAWNFSLVDIFNPDEVEMQVFKMMQVPDKFWQDEWTIKIQDNSNVRNLIKKDLETIADNLKLRRNWEENLQLLSLN